MALVKSGAEIVREDLEYICEELSEEFKALWRKKLLLIGGAGFLGYYLIQSLLRLNEISESGNEVEVTVYDNFMRGVPGWLKNLESNPTLNLVEHDITHPLPENIVAFDYIILIVS